MVYRSLWLAVSGATFAIGPLAAQVQDRIRINGYSSFEFEHGLSDQGRGEENASFDIDLFDIVLNVQASARFRVSADVTWEHGPATEDGRGNVALEYGFGEYTVSDGLRLRAGKVFVPFGIYNEIHTAKPAFLSFKEPRTTNRPHKMGTEERFYSRWAAGIMALGNLRVGTMDVDYSLLLSNGETESDDENPFDKDDNPAKSWTGRVRAMLRPDLRIGASIFRDVLTEYDDAGDDTGGRTTQLAFGGQAEWTPGAFGMELEYTGGTRELSDGTSTTAHAFATVWHYRVGDRTTPYIRFEFLNPNVDATNDYSTLSSIGVNVRVDRGLFLKVQLDRYISGTDNDRFGGVNFTELVAAVAIGF